MLSTTVFFLPLLSISVTALECVTPGFDFCAVPGSQSAVDDASALSSGGVSGTYDPSSATAGLMANIGTSSANAATPAQLARRVLSKRQDFTWICCPPATTECMSVDDTAFCYEPATTRLDFSDGSYAFDSNSTFYLVDGTIIDYKSGIYQYPNGTTETFTPQGESSETATESSSSGASSGTSSDNTVPGSTAGSTPSASSLGSSLMLPASSSVSQASTRVSTGASTSATTASAPGTQVASTVSSDASSSSSILGRVIASAFGILVLLALEM
ncbi:hypothetical protein LTR17_023453 [Elasticomyces elasticus]|nr:hypothetical protein LTR22_027294 [Elasticomyces elasticus]KAK5699200.1 hypothetical protein LTR17_023453 [Elasticomyces elasticus]